LNHFPAWLFDGFHSRVEFDGRKSYLPHDHKHNGIAKL
jgi:hypothetical protein